jgi:cold shock CspA family protein
MEEHLREEYDHIYRLGGALEPYHLTNDDKVEWVEVVAFSACFAASEAVYENSGNTLLSQETIEAFQRTVDVLTSGHPIASSVKLAAPHPDPVSTIGNDESIVGEIEWYNVKDDYGFVTNPRPGNRNDLYFNPDSMTGDLKSGEEIPEGMLVRVVVVEGPGGPKIKDGSMERI